MDVLYSVTTSDLGLHDVSSMQKQSTMRMLGVSRPSYIIRKGHILSLPRSLRVLREAAYGLVFICSVWIMLPLLAQHGAAARRTFSAGLLDH
ncbi:hypothetical protein RSOLAG1IB_04351 [Rhizoctonia solani AG-1 IB]|uniref:Uncharacterized protein n=1 Tax=Thanatephorus cucumeris (strain AG1-IB / isolate 7/3/14) TaxID=1108050 RepID=A0A0B7FUJ9_THACB|nr:hypothetical protein RSOLAG1IB_04351 [Rhizoctonia solani AG-1 IB]